VQFILDEEIRVIYDQIVDCPARDVFEPVGKIAEIYAISTANGEEKVNRGEKIVIKSLIKIISHNNRK
jgi:hypothetical protein